ncbi:unnamed protein product [Mycetohabitans rhizoxinica HKI 454]|uniref:Uncharacterized protein n=1 Tax=Mycetohabitans rhizoxinica (strain DSM 19002 / CIP 109453 / HKI 454) TaxID=882378 RepID=E5AP22_MYCRK|nr:unnamed protein product [Mycetohabitans rhizoxinica HKI 454]
MIHKFFIIFPLRAHNKERCQMSHGNWRLNIHRISKRLYIE